MIGSANRGATFLPAAAGSKVAQFHSLAAVFALATLVAFCEVSWLSMKLTTYYLTNNKCKKGEQSYLLLDHVRVGLGIDCCFSFIVLHQCMQCYVESAGSLQN